MQMPFSDHRVRERLAMALIGSARPQPDPWQVVAAACAGVAIGMVLGVLISQSGTQRHLVTLTERARDLGSDLVGRGRLSQTTVLEEAPAAGQDASTSSPEPVATH